MKILTENYLKSLEKEILTENYSDLFDKVYSDFRKEQSEFKTEIIEIGKIYYRARVGNDTMEAAIDDLNIISKIPYFGNNMDKPPARFVQGGRFKYHFRCIFQTLIQMITPGCVIVIQLCIMKC